MQKPNINKSNHYLLPLLHIVCIAKFYIFLSPRTLEKQWNQSVKSSDFHLSGSFSLLMRRFTWSEHKLSAFSAEVSVSKLDLDFLKVRMLRSDSRQSSKNYYSFDPSFKKKCCWMFDQLKFFFSESNTHFTLHTEIPKHNWGIYNTPAETVALAMTVYLSNQSNVWTVVPGLYLSESLFFSQHRVILHLFKLLWDDILNRKGKQTIWYHSPRRLSWKLPISSVV